MANEDNYKIFGGYRFNNGELLRNALTHSSYSNESAYGKKSGDAETDNERLEFLGDAVLELVVSEFIYNMYPELSEGDMTKLRASIVCESTLSGTSKKLGIGGKILMGRGEERTGGRERGSILADCFEAIAGAIFLDGGIDASKKFILDNLAGFIKSSRESFMTSDYKTRLQEEIQKHSKEPLVYSVIREEGPAHDRTFAVELTHCGKVLAEGQGKSKKEAEQSCAKQALMKLIPML